MTAATKRGYAEAFQIYADLGWLPIKLAAGTKFPPPVGFTGRDGVDPSGADMHAWAEAEPDGNLAIRLPADVVGIDCDDYVDKTGAATITEAENRWGRLPYSPKSTSRGPGRSGIRLYRIPAGVELVDRIEFPELDLGGVEVIQRHHRYVMAWPSIHGKTGGTYRWLGIDDGDLDAPPARDEIPDLPAAWVEALRAERHTRDTTGNSPEMPYNVREALTDGEASRRVSWRLGEAILACSGQNRHDDTRGHVLALLRYGKQGDPGVGPALTALRPVFVAAVEKDRPGGQKQANKEFRDFIESKRVTELLAAADYDDEQPAAGEHQDDDPEAAEATTWEAIDLGPWLRDEVEQPEPSIGICRTDGRRLIYPGREHAVLGETESAKTWLALACVAAELYKGNTVVYVHYEESDPASTVERLRLLGAAPEAMEQRLRFAAPARPVRDGWLDALLAPAPSLVVHDGVNEAMSLHGADIMAADGASAFRRRLILPCLRSGAATLACDHLPKNVDGRGRDAYGSVHKGNAIDGARIVLENREPFGRGLRGRSDVFITKDRPGRLRAHGKPAGIPGKTFIGTLVVDATPAAGPDFLTFYAPRLDDPDTPGGDTDADLADLILDTIAAQDGGFVGASRTLLALLRQGEHRYRDAAVRDALEDLVVAGRLVEVSGKRGARGYRIPAGTTSSETKK